jgi:hypothetical protein
LSGPWCYGHSASATCFEQQDTCTSDSCRVVAGEGPRCAGGGFLWNGSAHSARLCACSLLSRVTTNDECRTQPWGGGCVLDSGFADMLCQAPPVYTQAACVVRHCLALCLCWRRGMNRHHAVALRLGWGRSRYADQGWCPPELASSQRHLQVPAQPQAAGAAVGAGAANRGTWRSV